MLHVRSDETDGPGREAEVDQALAEFDQYFQSIQPENNRVALTRFERAAIKTFVAYMLGIRPNGQTQKG